MGMSKYGPVKIVTLELNIKVTGMNVSPNSQCVLSVTSDDYDVQIEAKVSNSVLEFEKIRLDYAFNPLHMINFELQSPKMKPMGYSVRIKTLYPNQNTKTTLDMNGAAIIVEVRSLGAMEQLRLEFTGQKIIKKDLFGKSDPYFVLYRLPDNVEIYRSEYVSGTSNPVWKPALIPMGQLVDINNYTMDDIVCIQCFDQDLFSKGDFIGTATVSLQHLISGVEFELIDPKKAKNRTYINSGELKPVASILKRKRFYELINDGLKISFGIAVDFSLSNMHPSNPESKHFLREHMVFNDYQNTIELLSRIFPCYGHQNFLYWGFGASVGQTVLPMFNVSMSSKSHLNGMEALKAYKNCVLCMTPIEPTCLAPVINNYCDNIDPESYNVLIIITDGEISDIEETKVPLN